MDNLCVGDMLFVANGFEEWREVLGLEDDRFAEMIWVTFEHYPLYDPETGSEITGPRPTDRQMRRADLVTYRSRL